MSERVEGDGWTMILGDCREVMASIGEVDHAITDPPYDARTHKGAACVSTDRIADGGSGESFGVGFESLDDASALARALVGSARRWAIAFCTLEQIAHYQAGAGDAWVRAGVWDRVNPAPQITGDRPGQAVDAIAIMHRPGRKRWNGGGTAGIWRHAAPRGRDRHGHPTQKPIPLMIELVEDFTDHGDLVLDPFAGSGTTGVACLRTGRRFVGVERKREYFDVAVARLRAEEAGSTMEAALAGQGALFGGAR